MKSPKKKSEPKHEGTANAEPMDRVRCWLLAAFVTVCVARPFLPSENAARTGSGQGFTLVLSILAAAYLAISVARGGFTRRWRLLDAAVAVFVLWCMGSAAIGVLNTVVGVGNTLELDRRLSSPRPAMNMAWEWAGLGLVYLLARQLVVRPLEARGLVAAMIGVAVAVSSLGYYQVLVALPAELAAYRQDPEESLARLGRVPPPGSPARARFERQLESTVPLATFGSSESLACFLSPWLVVAWGVALTMYAPGRFPRDRVGIVRVVILAVCLVAVLGCVVLTRSASAIAALGVGLALVPWIVEPFCSLPPGKRIGAAAGAVAATLVACGAVWAFDAQGTREAIDTLASREPIWQATLDMISDYPTLGVGPGDFENYFTEYQRPATQGTVRNPHNFLLEIWATAGTPAFALGVAVLAIFAWQVLSLERAPAETEDASQRADTRSLLVAGAVIGPGLAIAAGLPFGVGLPAAQLLPAALVTGGTLAVLWWWIGSGNLPTQLGALGVLVLCLAWLASGGVGYPSVAASFWLLMALAANQLEAATAPNRSTIGLRDRLGPAAALAAVILVAIGCYQTAFLPILRCRAAMSRATDPRLSEHRRMEELLEATKADDFAPEPWIALARLGLAELKEHPDSVEWRDRTVSAASMVSALAPHSSAAWRETAELYWEASVASRDAKLAKRAVTQFAGAAGLYPNSPVAQGDYAVALHVTGDSETSRRHAARALELNELVDPDVRLPEDLTQRLEEIVAAPAESGVEPSEPAEDVQAELPAIGNGR
ncbi:MAG: hypothetical protein DWQ37_18790 [Planctomycetota bacterium]|nr:MAG: hypothetical protein DWQ37_18790 [Planctomycetota bacterium]